MLKYAIKRILLVPVLLVIIGMMIYLMLSFSKVDAVVQMLPQEYTQEQYDAKKAEMGLDKPAIVQYVHWLGNALKGDLGISYKTKAPVIDEIKSRVLVSVKFSLMTTLMVTVLGVTLGVLCAVYQYSFFDTFVNILAKAIGSIPGFLLGTLLIKYLAQGLGWFPTYGFSTPKHWVLPIITQCLPFTANTIRQARSAMLDCIRQDYVKTARSKGARESQVIFKDTLRNALLPIITNVGTNFAIFIGGAVVVENVFAIPGVGSKVIEAINVADMPVVMACSMVIAIMFTGMALVIDLCYALVDPRLKSTFLSAKKLTKKVSKEGAAV